MSADTPLSLWLATRKGAGYDEHAGFLVAAEDEAAVRAIIDGREAADGWSTSATWSWERSEVECIGVAGPMVPRGILMEDFLAG